MIAEIPDQEKLVLIWNNGAAEITKEQDTYSIRCSQRLPSYYKDSYDYKKISNKAFLDSQVSCVQKTCTEVLDILGKIYTVYDLVPYQRDLRKYRLCETLEKLFQLPNLDIYCKPVMDAGGDGIMRIQSDGENISIQIPKNNLIGERHEAYRSKFLKLQESTDLINDLPNFWEYFRNQIFIQESITPMLIKGKRFEPRCVLGTPKKKDPLKILGIGAKLGDDPTAGNVGQGGSRISLKRGLEELLLEYLPDKSQEEREVLVKNEVKKITELATLIAEKLKERSPDLDYACIDFMPTWSNNEIHWIFIENNPFGYPGVIEEEYPKEFQLAQKLRK